MTLARTTSVAVLGVEGQLVEIQADLADGLPGVTMIGLPDAALQEARDRIRAAIVNSGEAWPARRMTLALLPATLPKRGSMFDVALAVGGARGGRRGAAGAAGRGGAARRARSRRPAALDPRGAAGGDRGGPHRDPTGGGARGEPGRGDARARP